MIKNKTELLRKSFAALIKGIETVEVGHVLAFDTETQLAQVQIGVMTIDRDGKQVQAPPLIECPVLFTGGSQFIIEHQIDAGDECAIFFSKNCIDGWVDTGGIAQNPIARYFDVSDAFIITGLRSQNNKISGFSNNGIKLRNKTGNKFVWLKNDGTAEITVDTLKINGNIVHNGNTTQTGNTNISGTSTAQNVVGVVDVSFGGISGINHRHSGVESGDENSGGPI